MRGSESDREAACKRVLSKKDHFLLVGNSAVTISASPYDELKSMNLDESSEASEMEEASERQLQNYQNSVDALSQKIFLHITARLNTSLFSKDQREQIKTLFPSIKILKAPDDLGIQEISGDFTEIDKVHQHLEKLHMGKREGASLSERRNSLPSKETGNEINVDMALYEYVMHVCQKEIEELKEKCNVCFRESISGDCLIVRIVSLDGKNNTGIYKAQQRFIHIYQKKTENLAQNKVPLLGSASQTHEIVQTLNAKFTSLFAKVEQNELILHGPRNELLEAQTYLEKMNDKESWHVKPVMITQRNYSWEKGVEIDASQISVLETLLAGEIKAIERKYDSDLVKETDIFNKKVTIRFKPKNKDSELYLCAYESFIRAFQKIMSSLVKKSFPLQSAEQNQKMTLFHWLQKENQNVEYRYSNDILTLIGLPNVVAQVAHSLNEGVREQAAGIHSQATTTTNDTPVPMEIDEADGFTLISKPKSEAATGENKENTCPICLDKLEEKTMLSKCKHEFCKECINKAMEHKPVCPICNTCYGTIKGNQPDGTMSHVTISTRLPGYSCDTININYTFPGGIQADNHPNPGKPFSATTRMAYLPNNKEGKQILKLLEKAFDQKLIFTVGQSRTSGANDVITWNDIHHKTNFYGGPSGFGYPDPDYLKRVREELKAKGIE
uniref:E3 ubiquitin-protein ligase n=1 Tax=Geotrypetes seraphini TaxID=260995 RepID=A0A6P8RGP6_GEOSA|nr:E3 ubiquitin-protein ligase DTX3L isoform X2 [Geotrypetes seraphini]